MLGHVGEKRGRDVVAAVKARAGQLLAAAQVRGLFLADRHVAQHVVQLLAGGQRPQVEVAFQAIADGQRLDARHQFFGERLAHLGIHQHAAGTRACLPAQRKTALYGQVHGAVQVGVGQHDQRILAAQFHLRARRQAGAAVDLFARGGGPGERDGAYGRRAGDGGAHRRRRADHQVQHARGQASLHKGFGQAVAR
ncbi:hypothetical protein D3C72_1319250 [compost metagenome]